MGFNREFIVSLEIQMSIFITFINLLRSATQGTKNSREVEEMEHRRQSGGDKEEEIRRRNNRGETAC